MGQLCFAESRGDVAYSEVAAQEGLAVGPGQRDGVWHVGALRVRAEVAVAYGGQADGIQVWGLVSDLSHVVRCRGRRELTDVRTPALELGDEVDGRRVHRGAGALGLRRRSERSEKHELEGNHVGRRFANWY